LSYGVSCESYHDRPIKSDTLIAKTEHALGRIFPTLRDSEGVCMAHGWLVKQDADIKGNAKWDAIKIIGGTVHGLAWYKNSGT
jgi:hypothetical protein